MLKVLLDARSVTPHAHGIGRYTELLLKGLDLVRSEWEREFQFSVLIHHNFPLAQKFRTVPADSKFLSLSALYEVPQILKRECTDLYFNPSFESFIGLPCRHIQIVHDLNHLKYGNFLQTQYYEYLLKRSIHRAHRMITVSQTMREDISRWSNRPKDEILVIPNAFEECAPLEAAHLKGVLSTFDLVPDRYFLVVGNKKPHKGILPLLSAYSKSELSFPMAVTLSLEDSPEDDPRIRYLGSVSSESLMALMQGARGLVFPTHYEGYGRPPVEAALLKTPVLVSDIPVLKEALASFSGEIEFLDPTDTSIWIETLTKWQNKPKGSVDGHAPTVEDVARQAIQSLR
jgi:glycosyltransferase involved in cell wall biosynthesis